MLRENNIKRLPANDRGSAATESPGTSSTSVPITRFSARAQTSRIKLSLGNSSTDRTRRQTGKVECRVSFSPSVSFRECATRFAYKDENSNSPCVSSTADVEWMFVSTAVRIYRFYSDVFIADQLRLCGVILSTVLCCANDFIRTCKTKVAYIN